MLLQMPFLKLTDEADCLRANCDFSSHFDAQHALAASAFVLYMF